MWPSDVKSACQFCFQKMAETTDSSHDHIFKESSKHQTEEEFDPELDHKQRMEKEKAAKEEEELSQACDMITRVFDKVVQGRAIPITCTLPITSTSHEPPKFSGSDKKGDIRAEDWLSQVKKYANWKGLTPNQLAAYFPLLLKDAAADWYDTLDANVKQSFPLLEQRFLSYFASREVAKLRDAAELWTRTQKPDESVADYFAAMKKLSKYLPINPEMLMYSVLNGLLGPIKAHVMKEKYTNIDDMLDIAKRAEISFQSTKTTDPMLQVILDETRKNQKLVEDNKNDYKQLCTQFETLAMTVQPVRNQQFGTHVPNYRQNNFRSQNRGRGATGSAWQGRGGRGPPRPNQRGAGVNPALCGYCGRAAHLQGSP
jgi:hypothetical protein